MEYSFEIKYIPGVENELPDLLSRLYKERNLEDSESNLLRTKIQERGYRMTVRMRDMSNKQSLGGSDVESELKAKLIRDAHEEGHFGVPIVVDKINEKGYTWPSIRADVARYATNCKTCRKYDLSKEFHPMYSETHTVYCH